MIQLYKRSFDASRSDEQWENEKVEWNHPRWVRYSTRADGLLRWMRWAYEQGGIFMNKYRHIPVVYFIQCNGEGGPIKIGVTTKLHGRIDQMRVNNPFPLTLLGAVMGDEGLERFVQGFFEEYRITGEWFEASKPLLDYIEEEARTAWECDKCS